MRPAGLIRPGWENVVVCSSGDSFTPEQAAQIADAQRDGVCRVVVVSDNWRRVPTAEVLWAGDSPWWQENLPHLLAAKFAGELWTRDEILVQHLQRQGIPIRWIREERREGLTTKPYHLYGSGNSTHMALNLAYLFGALRIANVGLDMRAAPDGRQHWFGEHAFRQGRHAHRLPFGSFIDRFQFIAADFRERGVECVNCSPGSALPHFEYRELSAVLEAWRSAA